MLFDFSTYRTQEQTSILDNEMQARTATECSSTKAKPRDVFVNLSLIRRTSLIGKAVWQRTASVICHTFNQTPENTGHKPNEQWSESMYGAQNGCCSMLQVSPGASAREHERKVSLLDPTIRCVSTLLVAISEIGPVLKSVLKRTRCLVEENCAQGR